MITIDVCVLFSVRNKKVGGNFATHFVCMILWLLQAVCALDKLTHSPDCAYVKVVVENHDVGILVLLQ